SKHIVLEIEGRNIRFTRADLRRRTVRILESRVLRLPSDEGAAVVFGIHDLVKGVDKEKVHAHVALGDPRFLHFDLALPPLGSRDLEALLEREARRLGSIPKSHAVQIGYRRLQKLQNGCWRYGVVALAADALQSILGTLAREGLSVDVFTSVEEAAVRFLPQGASESTVLLDHDAGQVRLIYVEDGVVTQRRQILVHGLEGGDASLSLDQLVMEVNWNLDYLRERGKKPPRSLVLSSTMPLSGDDMPVQTGDSMRVLPQLCCPYEVPEGQAPLGQPTIGILQSLLRRDSLSILGQARRRKHSRRRLVAAIAILATAASLASIGWMWVKVSALERNLQHAHSGVQELETREELLEADLCAQAAERRCRRLESILSRRRPMSLLLERISRAAPKGVELNELRCSDSGGIELSCQARRSEESSSLEKVRSFRSAALAIPFLNRVREEIQEYQSDRDWLSFRLLCTWRMR
ncbi:MAG: hypothetical protein ACE5F1_18655, partial [Planctomycetota bacterium]